MTFQNDTIKKLNENGLPDLLTKVVIVLESNKPAEIYCEYILKDKDNKLSIKDDIFQIQSAKYKILNEKLYLIEKPIKTWPIESKETI